MPAVLGLDAKLYQGGNDFSSPTWVEIGNARDVTLNLEKGTADITTRSNNGWRAVIGTLKDGNVEFQMVWDTSDASFTVIQQAFLNNDQVAIAAMDGGIAVSGSQGLQASMEVITFSRNEPLEEALTVDVSLRPGYFPSNPPVWATIP